jgi:hypothetical protein
MKLYKSIAVAFFSAALVCVPMVGLSGEMSGKVSVISLRPYGAQAYVQVSPGGLCGTDVFTIKLEEAGGKEMYALALSAVASGKKVELEVSNTTGCAGWGTRLQSMFIYP